MFLFEIDFKLIMRKLNKLLSNNASPENIIRDFAVLARSEKVIEERLAHLAECDIKRVMPWMIKCEKNILTRWVSPPS